MFSLETNLPPWRDSNPVLLFLRPQGAKISFNLVALMVFKWVQCRSSSLSSSDIGEARKAESHDFGNSGRTRNSGLVRNGQARGDGRKRFGGMTRDGRGRGHRPEDREAWVRFREKPFRPKFADKTRKRFSGVTNCPEAACTFGIGICM
jgi:hypothetical protein